MTELTQKLSDLGVSLWLDDLSRALIDTGDLEKLMSERNIVGVTTNPAIFKAAIAGKSDYDRAIADAASRGLDADAIITELTTRDVRDACDVFAPTYKASNGFDGRVSIEVDPRLAHEEDATVEQAKSLNSLVDRENVMIKIPATDEGLPAITRAIAEGISVNVTLIFSLERYRQVIDAYLSGLEKAAENGVDLSRIHSVASFFVSRVDSEIDKRLEAIGGDALDLLGKAGLANAQAAFAEYLEYVGSDRFAALKEKGANPQRALWASTGVKNEAYPDTMYVDRLVGNPVVNTVPGKTLEAVADHARIKGPLTESDLSAARETLETISAAGIDLDDVFAVLEREGVEKFEAAWEDLLSAVRDAASAAQ